MDGNYLKDLTLEINSHGDSSKIILDFYTCPRYYEPEDCLDAKIIEQLWPTLFIRVFLKQTNIDPTSHKNYISHYYEQLYFLLSNTAT